MTVSRCEEHGGNTEMSEERGRKLAPMEKESSEAGRGGGRGGEGAYSESETYAATSSRKQQPELKTEETKMTEPKRVATREGQRSLSGRAPAAGALQRPPHSGVRKEALGNNRKSCKKEPITCSSSCRSTTPVGRAGVPQPTPFPPSSCPLLLSSSSSSSLPSSPPRTSSSASASPSNGLHVTTCPKLRTTASSDRPDRRRPENALLFVALGLLSAVMAEMLAAVRRRSSHVGPSCGKSASSSAGKRISLGSLLDLFLVPNVLLAVIASSSLLWKASPPSALLENISGSVQLRLRLDQHEPIFKMQDFANSPLTSAFSPVLISVRSEKFQPRRTADPTGVYGPEESVMGWESDSHKEGNQPVSLKKKSFKILPHSNISSYFYVKTFFLHFLYDMLERVCAA